MIFRLVWLALVFSAIAFTLAFARTIKQNVIRAFKFLLEMANISRIIGTSTYDNAHCKVRFVQSIVK